MPAKHAYTDHDSARFVTEFHGSSRSPFARDKARIIHSSAWRRLAAKTQVLSPTAGIDFARNRLTHSLEVAQIGGEIAYALGLDEQIVDAACLAHDIGHPPFGHNGERALNSWMKNHGGFEGNAQTLRILTRLEPKRFNDQGESVGLNLTRAMLDASCKYPWSFIERAENSNKFGYYSDDAPIFNWLREGVKHNGKSAEAQVMDLADDIAYSVHDFEDAIFGGFIDPELLVARSGHDRLIEKVVSWSGAEFSETNIAAAFERIAKEPSWLTAWDSNMQNQAKLKNFTSDMIGRFARGAIHATEANAGGKSIGRYEAQIIVPEAVREEIAVLKGIVAAYVMSSGERQPTYQRQRALLTELLNKLWEVGPQGLDPQFKEAYETATTEEAARRAIADQIASLTDQAAISWYNRFCAVPLV